MKENTKSAKSFNLIIFSICYCFLSIFILLIFNYWLIRLISLIFFFFFLGYPLSLFFKNLDVFERITVSFGMSQILLLLIYYIYYIILYYLHITPTFECHILLIGIFCVSSNLILLFYFNRKNPSILQFSPNAIKDFIFKYKFFIIILVFGTILRLFFLDAPDFSTDDTFFVASSYPLIDPFQVTGLPPAPFTYLSGHQPPLSFVGSNITLNILNPLGWLSMMDWMGKFYFAFLGAFSIFSIFSLLNKVYGKYAGYIGALFFSVNTYALIVSRLSYQEIMLILLIIITMDFTYRENWKLTGFFLGLCLLTKITAIAIIPSIIIYLLLKNFRFKRKYLKPFLINLSYIAIFAMVLYLPVLIANMATYFSYGYADTFLSRIFGLKDPLSEAVGEPELPIGFIPAGLFAYAPLLNLQIENVIGLTMIPYLMFCVFLSLLDKPKIQIFNIYNYSFLIIFYLVFTSRWFQIVSLSPIIIPIIIIASRIVNLDKIFSKINIFINKSYPIISPKFKLFIRELQLYTKKINYPSRFHFKSLKYTHKQNKIKYQHFIMCSIVIYFLGFSFIYSWNTIAYPHYFLFSGIDDLKATFLTNNDYSTVGYLWIMRNGYDEVMEIIRTFKYSNIYIDDNHPKFSYIFIFILEVLQV